MRFDDQQQETLQAVCNRLIPPDEWPGAWEAGVGDYISRLLTTDAAPLLPLYEGGLAALNTESLARYNAVFAQLPPETQDELLREVESGAVQTTWIVSPPQFLTMLINHTAEGFYANPGNGGNRDCVSWRMMQWGDESDQ